MQNYHKTYETFMLYESVIEASSDGEIEKLCKFNLDMLPISLIL
jgi:hypothetical protein